MALQKNRRRVYVRGLGDFEVRQADPTPAATFDDVGFVKSVALTMDVENEEVTNDAGLLLDVLPRIIRTKAEAVLHQVAVDELNLIRNNGAALYAVRYFGLAANDAFQYFCMELAKLVPNLNVMFSSAQGRTATLTCSAIDQRELSYTVPQIYVYQTAREMQTEGMVFCAIPRALYNRATDRLLDISGFANHGTVTSDYATIWQTGTPDVFMRFDAINDAVNHGTGSVLNPTTSDFMVDAWVRVQAANNTAVNFFGKKNAIGTSNGWMLRRVVTSNVVGLDIADGTNERQISSTATVLQNVWTHVAVTVDRDGNGQAYVNGAASGTPVAISGLGSVTNALSLFIGRDGAGSFSQVDIGAARAYVFPSGLPSDIATKIANHYTGERTAYGV